MNEQAGISAFALAFSGDLENGCFSQGATLSLSSLTRAYQA